MSWAKKPFFIALVAWLMFLTVIGIAGSGSLHFRIKDRYNTPITTISDSGVVVIRGPCFTSSACTVTSGTCKNMNSCGGVANCGSYPDCASGCTGSCTSYYDCSGGSDEASCNAITGCTWNPTDCSGGSDESSCNAITGCTWNDPNCESTGGSCDADCETWECTGTADECNTFVTSGTCGGQPGCSWSFGYCDGEPECGTYPDCVTGCTASCTEWASNCDYDNQVDCQADTNCAWNVGGGFCYQTVCNSWECAGTPSECYTFSDLTTCGNTPGCTWITDFNPPPGSFKINVSGSIKAFIDPSGHFKTLGTITQNDGMAGCTSPCTRIEDSTRADEAYWDKDGNFYSRSTITCEGNPV